MVDDEHSCARSGGDGESGVPNGRDGGARAIRRLPKIRDFAFQGRQMCARSRRAGACFGPHGGFRVAVHFGALSHGSCRCGCGFVEDRGHRCRMAAMRQSFPESDFQFASHRFEAWVGSGVVYAATVWSNIRQYNMEMRDFAGFFFRVAPYDVGVFAGAKRHQHPFDCLAFLIVCQRARRRNR